MTSPDWPAALTIAGSDSGGGAGIQADLRTFTRFSVHGCSVITSLTAQNPEQILAVSSTPPGMVRAQLQAVFFGFQIKAIKTGLMLSSSVIDGVLEFLLEEERRHIPLVVDPVAVATSGRRFLRKPGLESLRPLLSRRATLMTPNWPEAEMLLGQAVLNHEQALNAARELHDRYGCAVLLKGGHSSDPKHATDILYDGHDTSLFKARRVTGIRTHGTGCVYSAAITALLAKGESLPGAIGKAKSHISRAIAGACKSGDHWVLHP